VTYYLQSAHTDRGGGGGGGGGDETSTWRPFAITPLALSGDLDLSPSLSSLSFLRSLLLLRLRLRSEPESLEECRRDFFLCFFFEDLSFFVFLSLFFFGLRERLSDPDLERLSDREREGAMLSLQVLTYPRSIRSIVVAIGI